MKYMAKYSQVCWDNDVKPIQRQCQQTLKTEEAEELCSINTIKDNYSLLENTLPQANLISKGFFQTEAQKALQNSQVEKAFGVIEQYIQRSERKFYRFLDTETNLYLEGVAMFSLCNNNNNNNKHSKNKI